MCDRSFRLLCLVLTNHRLTGSSLQERPSENAASVVSSAIQKLIPDEVSLEVFNSQYLQRHSSRADAILAAAKVSRTLDAPREEVEASVFNTLNADVELKLEVRSRFPLREFRRSCVKRRLCRRPSQPSRSCPRSSRHEKRSSAPPAERDSSSRRSSCLQKTWRPHERPSCRKIQ